MSENNMKGKENMKKGFTLAEVLVSLAVIGIVAAMTIPNLVQNYQSRAWATASEVFDKKLTQALKVMNVQGTLAGYNTTEAFINELSKHLKITKTCLNSNLSACFEDKVISESEEIDISELKTAANFGKEENESWGLDTNIVGFQLANGVTGLMAYNTKCRQDEYSNQITGENCLAVLYDVQGYSKPNTLGRDINSKGVQLTLSNNNLIKVPCKWKSTWGDNCASEEIYTEPFDAIAKEHLGESGAMGADADGAHMGWDLADKICKDKGMRLPNHGEFNSLLQDAQNGLISGFSTDEYWLRTGGKHNCKGSSIDYCGTEPSSTHRRVRCVK